MGPAKPPESHELLTASVSEIFDLTGCVAVITGGGTHLGRSMAAALAIAGADVHIAARRMDVLEATAADFADAGLPCTAHTCDVTDPESMDRLVDEIQRLTGRLDVMVCNAGGFFDRTYPPEASVSDFEKTINLIVVGTYTSVQAASRIMIPQGGGSIITVGSIHGIRAPDRTFHASLPPERRSGPGYHTGKGALINLTRSLASDLGGAGVRVNCLSPGQIPKPHRSAEFFAKCRDAIPLTRAGRPEDLAGAILLLASDAGSWITGHNLVVDGGWSV